MVCETCAPISITRHRQEYCVKQARGGTRRHRWRHHGASYLWRMRLKITSDLLRVPLHTRALFIRRCACVRKLRLTAKAGAWAGGLKDAVRRRREGERTAREEMTEGVTLKLDEEKRKQNVG